MQDKTGKKLSNTEIVNKTTLRVQTVWREFVIYVLHVVGCIPIHHIRRFFYHLAGVKIGKCSSLHMHTVFYNPSNIKIGRDTTVGEGAVLDGRDMLEIGDHVDIASEVMIYNSEHNINSEKFEAITEAVKIEDYVFIGPRAIILPGVIIGKGAVVGAGAVVTKSVNPFEIVGGIPAKVIGERSNKDPQYKLGRAAWFR